MRHYHLDRIVELEPGVRAVGVRSVSLSDDVFAEHFPGNPVLPGIYVLEGLAQTAGVLLTRSSAERKFALMVSIDRARFLSFARPGDVVRLAVAIESGDPAAFRVSGRATAGERTIATSLFTFRMVDVASMVAPEHRAAWERAIAVWLGEYPGSGDA